MPEYLEKDFSLSHTKWKEQGCQTGHVFVSYNPLPPSLHLPLHPLPHRRIRIKHPLPQLLHIPHNRVNLLHEDMRQAERLIHERRLRELVPARDDLVRAVAELAQDRARVRGELDGVGGEGDDDAAAVGDF